MGTEIIKPDLFLHSFISQQMYHIIIIIIIIIVTFVRNVLLTYVNFFSYGLDGP
jgi:hypothetical protein